jgi:mRNA-degrading endonuclease RelE of RelBE toxin-antitoxin system
LPYIIDIVNDSVRELKAISAYRRRAIARAIDEQPAHQPTVVTRNRKPLPDLSPSFEHVPSVWELRVGDYRVFYDVNEEQTLVSVRAIRHKSSHKRTEDMV